MYEKIFAYKLAVKGSVNVMKVIIRYLTKLRKVNLSEIEIEAEAWRVLIWSSQKYFPSKKRKGILEKNMFGIRMAVFRLDQE